MGKGLELKAGECVLAVCHPGIGWAWKGGTDLESHVNARRGILWRPFSTLNRPRCLRFQSLKIPGRIQMNAARNTSEDTLSGSWNAKERQMPHLDSLSTCPWFLHASPERAAVQERWVAGTGTKTSSAFGSGVAWDIPYPLCLNFLICKICLKGALTGSEERCPKHISREDGRKWELILLGNKTTTNKTPVHPTEIT